MTFVLLARIFSMYVGVAQAWFMALLASWYPTFFILNISAANDTHYTFFFVLSLFFFQQALLKLPQHPRQRDFFWAGLAFGYGFWGHTQLVLWTPMYLALIALALLRDRKRYESLLRQPIAVLSVTARSLALFSIGPLMSIIAYVLVMIQDRWPNGYDFTVASALQYLFFNNARDFREIFNIGIMMRFVLTQLSSLGIALMPISIILLIKKDRWLGITFGFSICALFYPSILYNYGSFYGRTLSLWGLLCWMLIGYAIVELFLKRKVLFKLFAMGLAVYLMQYGLWPVLYMQAHEFPHQTMKRSEAALKQGNYLMHIQDAYSVGWYGYHGELTTLEQSCWATSFSCIPNMKQLNEQGITTYVTTGAIFYSNYKYDGMFWQVDRAEYGLFPESSLAPSLRDARIDLAVQDEYQAIYDVRIADAAESTDAARILKNIEHLQPGESAVFFIRVTPNVRQISSSWRGWHTALSSHKLNHNDWLLELGAHLAGRYRRDFSRSMFIDRTNWAILPYAGEERFDLLLTDGSILTLMPEWLEDMTVRQESLGVVLQEYVQPSDREVILRIDRQGDAYSLHKSNI